MTSRWFKLASMALVVAVVSPVGLHAIKAQDIGEQLSFNRDIRPILSDKCFHCHGPDEHSRESDLRLDLQDEAFNVIEAGSLEDSELYHRIISDDPDSRMPPAEVKKPLSEREIDLLKRWIQQGANWSEFWAYQSPRKHEIPKIKEGNFDNWIDNFVVARLEQQELSLSPRANETTLLRRVYFDLIGLPPTPAQVDAFVADSSDDAFEKVVDELLASKHFGERMAIYWLDLVRYADTVGYHGDQPHNISPYRDWVINAFNENMAFDQFTREQLAGDLLPIPTEAQKIASGYNRLLQTTHEGGLQPAEYSAIYAADRVRNVSLVWMGATVGCAQCHDHKYDPYTSKDFYSLAAFFADIDDEKHFKVGTNTTPTKRPPELLIIDEASRKELAEFDTQITDHAKNLNKAKQAASDLQNEIKNQRDVIATKKADSKTKLGNPDAEQADAEPAISLDKLRAQLPDLQENISAISKQLNELRGKRAEIELRGDWTMITKALPEPRMTRVLNRGDWMDKDGEIVEPAIPAFLGKLEIDASRANRLDLANWFTDVSEKGNGLLTARVFANRFWYLMMGVGVSRSLDDFGGQGEAPAYPELLDNLAIEFVDNDWDVKRLIRTIVTSQTYQQDSIESDTVRKLDPYNQLFSHQSRYRLPAELIHDNALAISGLLRLERIGGRSVKPAQPTNYYQHLNFPKRKYVADRDENQWRRGVYVHWQRMFLHPSLKAFDAPSREECTAERAKSNTPSAALALLNDPIFVESARVFAARIINESQDDGFDSRLRLAFKIALSREPDVSEISVLKQLQNESLIAFEANPDAADNLQSIGQAKAETKLDSKQMAAWTTVARAILNLNETLTRN